MGDRQRTVLEGAQADCVRYNEDDPYMVRLMMDRTGLSYREVKRWLFGEADRAGVWYKERTRPQRDRIGDIKYTSAGNRTVGFYDRNTGRFSPMSQEATHGE